MAHPAEIPMPALLAALPVGAKLTGMWVQTAHDGTMPDGRGPVHVSIQWRRPGGYVASESADGDTVAAAGSALLARLQARITRL